MKVVTLLSGGLDSTVLTAFLFHEGHEVYALTVDYRQRHRFEIQAATRVARALKLKPGITHHCISFSCLGLLASGSSQTDLSIPVPEGHYADASMQITVVPNRNMVLLSLAAAWAMSLAMKSGEPTSVCYAVHAGDHPIYPDCRPEFIEKLNEAIRSATGDLVFLDAPFVRQTKAALVTLGHSIGAPLELTYSCYKGEAELHCGQCGTCVERREAFRLAGVPDPTIYTT
jgi:7-cyano-7-deazaguanine synthase